MFHSPLIVSFVYWNIREITYDSEMHDAIVLYTTSVFTIGELGSL